MVEGHADSRGTNEYNLALGERRADAARDYLVSLGLAADRVTIVSKGEEAALLHRRNRGLLAAEPPRPLRLHGEVSGVSQTSPHLLQRSARPRRADRPPR